MSELIKVTYNEDRPTVLGRDLHKFLEVETRYNDWFKRMCEYGFIENIDYYSFLSNGEGFGKSAKRKRKNKLGRHTNTYYTKR